MVDLVDDLLDRLNRHRIPALDLGDDAVHPAYPGLSLLNLPSSLCRWLGAPDLPHPPLALPEIDSLAGGAQNIVLGLIDAIALHRFLKWMHRAPGGLHLLAETGLLATLTSVVPSSTSAALTTLWTGHSPAEHGIVGYELFLKEFGLVANMITHSPAGMKGPAGMLDRAGFNPRTALPVPSLGRHLSEAGIGVHAFLPQAIRGSGLSRMHFDGGETYGYHSPSDLWGGVKELVESPATGPRLIWAYMGQIDTLSHRFGPDSDRVAEEFTALVHALLTRFVEPLAKTIRRETLLILLSDHGQINTPNAPHLEVRNHPAFMRRLHVPPTGENRLSYLHIKPGRLKAVEDYIAQQWPEDFSVLPSFQALQAGLFGPGAPASETPERIGDRILVAKGASFLWWGSEANPLLGRHGGLSAEEMLVPLLAIRLG